MTTRPWTCFRVWPTSSKADPDPLVRQMDWWMGPLILVGAIFLIVGAVNVIQWMVDLVQ
jgi:hypothetical protein